MSPFLGDRAAAWRHARRYDPDDETDASVLADIDHRLAGLKYLDTPVWLFDAERCQFLWANPPGLEIWRAETVRECQLRDIASSQSEAVYSLLNDYLAQVRAGGTPAVWVTLSPQGTLQRYYQSHHLFTLSDGRDCLLIEARAEPPAEALLSLASNHSLMLGLYDLEGALVSGNPRFGELRVRNDRLETLQSLHPEAFARSDWREALRRTREQQGSGVLQTERGERPFRWEIRLLNERQGSARVLVSFFDQTDRLVAEAEQARGALLEISLDAILIIDEDGIIIEFNPAAEALFGHRREDALGRPMAALIIPPELRAAHAKGMKEHQARGTSRVLGERVEMPALRADGSRFLAELAVIQFTTQGRTQYIGFVRDVDQLRRMEARVHDERTRFSSVFEHTPDPVLILNQHREIILANLACSVILDWPLEELAGRSADAVVRPWTGGAHWGTRPTHQVSHRHAEWIPIELRSNQFLLDGVEHSVWLLRDLRPEIQAAQEKDRLAQKVKQSQRLKELGTLAGGVAHYFNNLLAAIIGNIEVIETLPDLSEDMREHVREVGTVSMRGKEMVRRILAFSRKAPTGREALEVEPIAREALKLVRLAYPPTVQLALVTEPALPRAEINSSQIHQVLVNLITNACQAIGGRPGRVEIRMLLEHLPDGDPGLELEPGRYVRVDVVDDGPGMDAETEAQAFTPFFTTKPVDEGTGLGLAEVHGIAAEHGGGTRIETQPGAGCRVSLYLPALATPAVQPTRSAERPEAARGSRSLHGLRLLFLDDEAVLGRLASRLLGRHKVRIEVFQEPLEALARLERCPDDFDIVMTDISMPQMSGFDFAARVSAIDGGIPIVFASGRDLTDIHEVVLSNPTGAIEKPYQVKELVALLDRLWVRRTESDE